MRKTLISFIAFAGLLMVCRHIVSDIRQEERITVLEHMVENIMISKTSDTVSIVDYQPLETFSQKQKQKTRYASKATTSTTKKLIEDNKNNNKFSNPILLELNVADSAILTQVPGIGAKSASIIIKYREQLGGFYTPYQLSEKLTWESAIEHMDEWCTLWFKSESSLIRKVNVNTADFKQLLRHPYLEYNQVKALVSYRDRHTRIDNISVLSMMEVFTEEDIERLKYYLDF